MTFDLVTRNSRRRWIAGARGALLLCLCAAALPSREARGQTLEECLALARAHAPALAATDADLARAEEAIREARAALSPTLRLGASYVQNSEAPKAVFPIPGRPSPEVVNLGSATEVDLRTDAAFTLYSGGRDPALVRAAEAARNGEKETRAQTDADLVERVSQAFYRVIAAQRLEDAAREVEASSRSHLGLSAARVRAGVAQRVDSLRAAVDLSERSVALLRAREAVRLARVDLETAMGATLDSTRALVPPGEPDRPLPELEAEVGQALQLRPELKVLDQNLRGVEANLAAARAARRPQGNLTGTAEYTAPNLYSDYWDFTDPGLKTYKLYAGIAASMPLLDGGLAGARVAELESQRQALQALRRDLELGVRRDVEQAFSDLRVALSVWPSDQSRVGAAREALRLAEAGYKGGTSTAADVSDAEAALAQARAEEAQTLMDYWMARAALDRAVGAPTGKEN